ncbi:pentapeptide repeat-containing protein [Planctomicrobium piriforme]|uniref:Pentapeptide repeat-containing protein n=1 Tax=Planctomicrobium piriforme TaxID=1576369 RepID=A0A1I3EIA8_9PLAN|nr:pentapeptide repeat-containing protein [Planctomicrobium piriforme]SFH98451.1 Pentapeptide repeat-containing protein [Planctomicrobium piriforme]
MSIEILNRWTNAVLYRSDLTDVSAAVQKAVKDGANLTRANLYGANLTRANLTRANLTRANLTRANLTRANLYGANLYGANLDGANLYGANLYGANLYGANLDGANLYGANLTRANLYGANLYGANLYGANLDGANLYGANLDGANLDHIRQDLILAILQLPDEIPFLRQAIVDGKIDGSTYSGECACLAGTMAHACHLPWDEFESLKKMPINASSPRELWFTNLKPGDTPETSEVAKITLQWVDEALLLVSTIRGTALQLAGV